MIYGPSESAVATAPAPSTADEPVRRAVASLPAPAPAPLPTLLLEGVGTVVSALGAAAVTWQLTQGLGFVAEQRREAMLPFNLSKPTNTLFQYAVCLAVALLVLVGYGRFVAPRLGRVAQRLDLLAGTALLPLAGLAPGPRLALAALVLRAGVGAWLLRGGERAALEPGRPLERLAAWAPLGGLLGCAAGLALVLPSGISVAVARAPGWLLLVAASPALLFLLEEVLPTTALRWERRLGLALGLVAIPLLTFRVAAPYFDFSTMVGPVNDVLRGKDIGQGVVSTYGFLLTYALAAGFWLFQVSDLFMGLAVSNALAFTLAYGALLLFLARRIQRISLCLASLGVLLAVHHFHVHVPLSWLPQSGFLRFGGMVPLFLLLYAWSARPRSSAFEWAFAGCAALATLWTIEVGLYIVVGLAAAGAHQLWLGAAGERTLRLIAKTAAAVCLVLASYTAWILLRHGQWPVWAELLHFQRAFSAGLAMGPVTSIERWPVPILIYLATLFVAVRAGHRLRHGTAWVFLAAYGLASMVYPLGKASIWDLGRVALPAIVLVAVLASYLFQSQQGAASSPARSDAFEVSRLAPLTWLGVFACTVCFVFAETTPHQAMAANLARSGKKPIAHASPSWHAFLPAQESRVRFESDLAAITALVPPDAALPILSRNDTLYYVFAERKSAFKNSFYPHFFFKSDIDEITRNLETSPIGYLFVDNSGFQVYENRIDVSIGSQVRERLAKRYRLVKRAGFLDVYQRL